MKSFSQYIKENHESVEIVVSDPMEDLKVAYCMMLKGFVPDDKMEAFADILCVIAQKHLGNTSPHKEKHLPSPEDIAKIANKEPSNEFPFLSKPWPKTDGTEF